MEVSVHLHTSFYLRDVTHRSMDTFSIGSVDVVASGHFLTFLDWLGGLASHMLSLFLSFSLSATQI